jgi:hypothetical protein
VAVLQPAELEQEHPVILLVELDLFRVVVFLYQLYFGIQSMLDNVDTNIFPCFKFSQITGFFTFLDEVDERGRPTASHLGFCISAVHSSTCEIVEPDIVSKLLMNLSLPEDSAVQIGLHLQPYEVQEDGVASPPVTHRNVISVKIPLKLQGVVSPGDIEVLRLAQSQIMGDMVAAGITPLRMDEYDYRSMVGVLLAADNAACSFDSDSRDTPMTCFPSGHTLQVHPDHLIARDEFELKALSLRLLPQEFSAATLKKLIQAISSVDGFETYLNVNLHFRGQSGEQSLRAGKLRIRHPAIRFVPTQSPVRAAAIQALLDSVDNGYPVVNFSFSILRRAKLNDPASNENNIDILNACSDAGLVFSKDHFTVLPVIINSLPLLYDQEAGSYLNSFILTTEYVVPFVPIIRE